MFTLKLVVWAAVAAVTVSADRSSLRKALFADYDKLVNPEEKTTVNFGVEILDLAYCPLEQVLTARSWAFMSWHDSRLSWNPDDFGGQKALRLPSSEIFIPDIALYNSVSTPQLNYFGMGGANRVVIMSDGTVIFVPPMTWRAFCPRGNSSGLANGHASSSSSSNGDSPVLTVNCTLMMGSWTYDMSQIDIKAREKDPISFKYMKNTDIEVVSHSMSREQKEYPCCPNEFYPHVTVELIFKQKSRHGMAKAFMKKMKKHMKAAGGDQDSSEESNAPAEEI